MSIESYRVIIVTSRKQLHVLGASMNEVGIAMKMSQIKKGKWSNCHLLFERYFTDRT
jgi:hypothetical protein